MINVEQNEMRELNLAEIEAVAGAYSLGEFWSDTVSFCKSVVTGFTETMNDLHKANA